MDIATCVAQLLKGTTIYYVYFWTYQDLYDTLSMKGIAFVDAVAETQYMECFGPVNARQQKVIHILQN